MKPEKEKRFLVNLDLIMFPTAVFMHSRAAKVIRSIINRKTKK